MQKMDNVHGEHGSSLTQSLQFIQGKEQSMCFLCPKTNYVELIANQPLPAPTEPYGPGYPVLFDVSFPVKGWKEIRVWVHVFVDNYETTPITSSTRLELRFMHSFTGGSFNYEGAVFTSDFTSYINGYTVIPLVGEQLRLVCHPENLPAGPYRLTVTYLLTR
jgi:hypothetical protein